MNNRIVQLRKSREWTQDKFADEMGISKNYVSLIENGKKIPSDRLISDICQEFNVNEKWLRTGALPKKPVDKVSTYLGQIKKGNDEFIKDLIVAYMELDSDSKKALQVLTEKMYKERKERGQ